MIAKIKIEKEFDLKTLVVNAGVESDTEDGDNVPCKEGSVWNPEIDIETGKILNWIQGVKAEIHYKVVDCCGWELKDDKGEVILSTKDGYVPNTLCPADRGYGDYIIMNIDENGIIENFKFNLDDFIEGD
jgi:hypothetical protein